jgi:FMN phosphatase YigB (HAD superfamily)
MIQAISLDLWGTLIKASPEFRYKKIELVKPFLTEHKTDTEINAVYTMVKKSYVENSEKFGISYDNLELFKVIIKKLKLNISAQNLAWYYCDLFLKNPPILLPKVGDVLKILSKDYQLYLSSNTTLVKGFKRKPSIPGCTVACTFNPV